MDEGILIRYLTDRVNDTEREEIAHYIDQSPEHKEELFRMKELWTIRLKGEYGSKEKISSALDRLNKNIENRRKEKKRRLLKSVLRYAAVAIILISCGIGTFSILTQPIKYEAQGSRTEISLEDGTHVWLNKYSTLEVPSHFARNERRVKLTGEAFFNVEKEAEKPFYVESSNAQIKVLGTSFNVKSYPQDYTEAVLSTGKITFEDRDGNELATLLPNDKVSLEYNSHKIVRSQVHGSDYGAWRYGQHIFDDAMFFEIVKYIEHQYKVKVHLSSPELGKRKYRCIFNEGETLEEILQMLDILSPIQWREENNEIYINDK